MISSLGYAVLWAATILAPFNPSRPSGAPERTFEVDANPVLTTFPLSERPLAATRSVRAGNASRQHGAERLVYSNTLGEYVLSLPANQWVADDLTLTAGQGCKLSRFEFVVTGRANPEQPAGPYRVDFALYDNCPQAGGSSVIAGTEGSIDVMKADEDAVVRVELVVPAKVAVPLPPTVWLAVKANRSNVGVIAGAPALVGYTADRVDFPGSACSADTGGFPGSVIRFNPHASFNAELYARDGCPSSFPVYRSFSPARSGFNEGSRWCFADDIELTTDSCDMVTLEIGVRLNSLTSTAAIRTSLFEDELGLPGAEIPDTSRATLVNEGPGAYVVRHSFDPPIPLTTNKLWVAFESVVVGAGWILARSPPDFGVSDKCFARSQSGRRCSQMLSDGDWEVDCPSDPNVFGAFEVSVYCAGDPPPGACCDPIFVVDDGSAVCREVPELNCAFPTQAQQVDGYPSHWVEGGTCDAEPFEHPCGEYACCVTDQPCQNLTKADCDLVAPEQLWRTWNRGLTCNEGIHHCAVGECAVARNGTDCWSVDCSDAVCRIDNWCCEVAWDEVCVEKAVSSCEAGPLNRVCEGRAPFRARNLDAVDSVAMNNSHDELFFSSLKIVSCYESTPAEPPPGATWYSFVAAGSSARIETCHTFPPKDIVITVFEGQEPITDCSDLLEIACVNAEGDCPNGGSSVCVEGLVPGETYYVQLGSSNEANRGAIRMDIMSPCNFELAHQGVGDKLLAKVSRQAARNDMTRVAVADAVDRVDTAPVEPPLSQNEIPDELPRPAPRPATPPIGSIAHAGPWVRDGFESIQVNVNSKHFNIPGDAANEPSIAVDPVNSNRMAIGWRQFDSVNSNFRQAGYAYTEDGGQTWTFPGVIEPGVFRSDPVLDSNAEGIFYYFSLTSDLTCDLFTSFDGGKTWPRGVSAFGGDKGWMTVDKLSTVGKGNIYASWTGAGLTRSVDGGASFENPVPSHAFQWGSIAVGLQGEVYVTSDESVSKSYNAADPNETPAFSVPVDADLGGRVAYGASPNPDGIVGQTWIAVDTSNEPTRGNVYRLASVRPYSPSTDPLDVMFTRSEDGGYTWSEPVRLNDDPPGNGAWQWFGTMSVAPNGRIDAIWNDTRNTGEANLSELHYTNSFDGGRTWAKNIPVSPMFDSWVGWPQQDKLGDYYHMVSDNTGASVAYAATFNGEQDVYYLRIGEPIDCNNNDVPDIDDILVGGMPDCDSNSTPDECQSDLDADGFIDACDDDIDNDGIENGEDNCPRNRPNMIIDEYGAPRADTTGQCNVDLGDYWRFRNCMLNGRPGAPAPLEACLNVFDSTGDEVIDLADFQAFQASFSGSR